MDYTTLARVKSEMHAAAVTDDALLTTLITAASRAIDRKVTMTAEPGAVDYFSLAAVTETLRGQADKDGTVWVYAHKPRVTGVTAFRYREKPIDAWVTVDPTRVDYHGLEIMAYPVNTSTIVHKRVSVEATYTGGLAALSADLPADLIEVATLLTIRFYKEAESGLGDAIGVAEMATMIYTKSWPVRALDMLNPFMRRVGWSYVA